MDAIGLWWVTSKTHLEIIRDCISEADDDNPVTSRFHCLKNGCCDHHEWCRFWASVGECKVTVHILQTLKIKYFKQKSYLQELHTKLNEKIVHQKWNIRIPIVTTTKTLSDKCWLDGWQLPTCLQYLYKKECYQTSNKSTKSYEKASTTKISSNGSISFNFSIKTY